MNIYIYDSLAVSVFFLCSFFLSSRVRKHPRNLVNRERRRKSDCWCFRSELILVLWFIKISRSLTTRQDIQVGATTERLQIIQEISMC